MHFSFCHRRAGKLYHFDVSVVTRRSRQGPIARDESGTESFRKGYISRIVGAEIRPELPDSRQEQSVRVTDQGKTGEVIESGLAASCIKFLG